ncbi:LacI family transcriptional regulator [Catenovulum sp. 2E275]|uniref:LacI family DNA-binding transcriptional regulator n=1 Tax=Catenovulum sp. 2E275 TaxID=2980497 RepID=UPI0021CE4E22|nr:LacI family DNA-binding transcriptional regulator [Catenovulum sp. 2E275]MCU4677248.1 LacI family transcriptional regulator [Catenovulum sp. 2E275]
MAKIGIKQVAALSGVSIATVSRTLRNPEIVSEKTRQKVNDAVKKAGYKPNKMGSSLRTQESGNIVVIIPDVTDPFNSGIICSIEREAQKMGYSVLLGDTQNDPKRAEQYAEMVEYGQADGILLFSYNLPLEVVPDEKGNVNLPPIVNVCESTAYDGIHKVMVDDEEGARKATQHLIDLGHKRIAVITGNENTTTNANRLAGYRKALRTSGIQIDDKLVMQGNYQIDSGVEQTKKLLLFKDRPTAIFCFCDLMAMGAIKVLHDHGYSVPRDMSVIGFDDIKFAEYTYPAISTIRQPVDEIGKTCMHQLYQLLKGKPAEKYIELKTELIVRDSTGPAPRK